MLFPRSGASQSCKTLYFWYRFWTRRLTLKITPTQLEKRCPSARQAMLFPRSGASLLGRLLGKGAPKLQNPLFFIGSGRDVWHWRSPQCRSRNGVLQLARPCRFPVPEPAFLGRLLGKGAPKLQNHLFFIGSGRDVWHWRSPQRRSKNGVLQLARPCCFPVPEPAFFGKAFG